MESSILSVNQLSSLQTNPSGDTIATGDNVGRNDTLLVFVSIHISMCGVFVYNNHY
jgi:hypothetical protein